MIHLFHINTTHLTCVLLMIKLSYQKIHVKNSTRFHLCSKRSIFLYTTCSNYQTILQIPSYPSTLPHTYHFTAITQDNATKDNDRARTGERESTHSNRTRRRRRRPGIKVSPLFSARPRLPVAACDPHRYRQILSIRAARGLSGFRKRFSHSPSRLMEVARDYFV